MNPLLLHLLLFFVNMCFINYYLIWKEVLKNKIHKSLCRELYSDFDVCMHGVWEADGTHQTLT
jgi:hypothetical protein